MNMNPPWTNEERALVWYLHTVTYETYKSIAVALNRTQGSVCGFIGRYNTDKKMSAKRRIDITKIIKKLHNSNIKYAELLSGYCQREQILSTVRKDIMSKFTNKENYVLGCKCTSGCLSNISHRSLTEEEAIRLKAWHNNENITIFKLVEMRLEQRLVVK